MRSIYSIFAVILPVSLGLGLVYLSSAGRIDTITAIVGAIAIVVVMGGGCRGARFRDTQRAGRRRLSPR